MPEDIAEENLVPYEAPGTAVGEVVAEVWAALLDVERISLHDNLFAPGGDSLMAVRAVVHLRRHLELDVPIRVLFDSPTLADKLLDEQAGMSEDEAQSLLTD